MLAHGPVGGFCVQAVVSMGSYIGICIGSIFSEPLREDMSAIGYNPFNGSEQNAVNAKVVSFYKGIPIYRTGEGFRSGSFCAILLSSDSNAEDLKHESGHNVQQIILGPITFLAMIGAPSAFEFSTRDYYARPWEITADMFGGVSSRIHTPEDMSRGEYYLATSLFTGPFAYFFIIGEY